MNISFLTNSLPVTSRTPNDPAQSDEITNSNESNISLDFSENDKKLSLLIKKGICDDQGNPSEKFKKIIIKSISKSGPIFTSLLKVLDYVQPDDLAEIPGPIQKLISHLKKMNPGKIKEVQIIGSQLKRVLIDHPEILTSWMEEVLGQDIDKENLDEWTKQVLANENFLNDLHAGQETDIRIVCDGRCKSDDLSKLSRQAKNWLEANLSHRGSINKFAIINNSTTLAGFEFNANPKQSRELIFTTKPATLSTETCLFVTMDKEELRFGCLGFNVAKFLIDSICNIYTPFALDNPQAWIRLMYYSKSITMKNREELMIEGLFKPFEKVKCLDDFYFRMETLGYKKWDVRNYIREAIFSEVQDPAKTLYSYFLIVRRIKAKSTAEGLPPSSDSNALFVFNCCQSLQMHGQLSDQSIAKLIGWLNEDNLLIYPDTHPFLTVFAQDKIPFSVISATTTLAGWIEQPESFIRRHEPFIFLTKLPFTLRVPSDMLKALKIIQNYLEPGGNSEILKPLYQSFIFKTDLKKTYQQPILQMLNLNEESFAQETDFLMNCEDPFICTLGVQIKLMSGYSKNPYYIFNKLPNMLALSSDFEHLLKNFYEYIRPYCGTPEGLPGVHSLADWIVFLIDSNQTHFILCAYSFWKKNKVNNSNVLNLRMLESISTADSGIACQLFTELYPCSDFDLKFLEKIIFNISSYCPIDLLYDEIYPLMFTFLTNTTKKNLEINEKFSQFIVAFLDGVKEQKKQHLLTIALAATLKGYIKFSEIPKKFKPILNPILPFLTYRHAKGLIFSSSEIETILTNFKSEEHQPVPASVNLAWISILSWIFYPDPISDKKYIPFEALREVNTYFRSEECNTEALKGIYEVFFTNEHPQKQTEICSLLGPEELLLILEISYLLKHSDPMINQVGLNAAINFPKHKNLNLFLLRLSELLNDASPHQKTLAALFKKIALKFNLSTEKLNPLLLNDWIKLLAQTRDPYFLDLGCDIWKENQAKCQKNSDLILFQALTLSDPNLALHHFCEMHDIREPRLTVEECITCLGLLGRAYETQPLKIGLKRLIPILSDLINQKKPWKSSTKKKFSPVLVFIINGCEVKDFDCELLLKSIAEDFFHPSEMKSELLDSLFFAETRETKLNSSEISQKARIKTGRYLLEKKDPRCLLLLDALIKEKISPGLPDVFNLFLVECLKNLIKRGFRDSQNFVRLNKLIQTSPPSKDPITHEILTGFFKTFLTEDPTKIAESDLNLIEELVIKHREILFKLANWNNRLLAYLKRTPISDERPHLYELFNLLQKDKKIQDIELLRTIAVMMDKYFPQTLSPCIEQYITSNKESPIEIFKNLQEFEIVQVFIRINFHYKLTVKDLALNIWGICFELSGSEKTAIAGIIKLLELQDKKSWHEFLTTEKDHNDHSAKIPTILNRFFKEDLSQKNKNVLEWISFLLQSHLESSFSGDSLFYPDCSESNFIEIALKLLDRETSLGVKKYLFTSRPPHALLENAARREIDSQLKSVKNIDIKFCLELRNAYLSKDNALLVSIMKSLPSCKDKTVIQFIIEEIEKLISISPDDLITCWISIFEFLNRTHDQKIWHFLIHVPHVFNSNGQSGAREMATKILIEGAALELKNRSKKMKNSEYSPELLWNKIRKLRPTNNELYLLVLSCMEKDFIISNPVQCLLTLEKIYISYASDYKKLFYFQKLKGNFEILLEQFEIENNFKPLTPESCIILEKCLQFCCKVGILDKSNFQRHFKLALTIQEKILEHINQRYIADFQHHTNRFFDLYTLFSQIANFETQEARQLLFLAIKYLDKIIMMHQELEDIKNTSSDFLIIYKDATKNQNTLTLLFDFAISKVLPENSDKFCESYFETILKQIVKLELPIDDSVAQENIDHFLKRKYKYALHKAVCSRFIEILKIKIKNKSEFTLTKKMFERAMDWKIDSCFSISKCLRIHFIWLHEFLSPAKLDIYKNDRWLFLRLNLIQENEEIDKLNNNEKRIICGEIINKLIGYGSEIGILSACSWFDKYFNCNFTTDVNLKLNMFNSLMKASCKHSLIEINGNSFLYQIYYHCYVKVSKKTVYDPRNREYFLKFLQLEFNTTLQCIQDLLNRVTSEENDVGAQLIPHYTKLLLDIAGDLKTLNYIQDNNAGHISRLEKIIGPIVDAETLHIQGKIKPEINQTRHLPRKAIKALVEAVTFKSKPLPGSMRERQYELLAQLFTKLISINVPSIEKKCELILTSLLEVIYHSQNLDKSKLKTSFILAFEWLKEQGSQFRNQLAFNFIEYHFFDFNPEDEQHKFENFCISLFQTFIPADKWFCFHYILTDRVQKIFSLDPQNFFYQHAAVAFLTNHLNYFQWKPEEIGLIEKLTISIIFMMLKSGLINPLQSDWNRHLIHVENEFNKYRLNTLPIKLAQLMLRFDDMSLDEKKDAIQSTMNPLGRYVKESNNEIVSENFISLLEKIPDIKDSLRIMWESRTGKKPLETIILEHVSIE